MVLAYVDTQTGAGDQSAQVPGIGLQSLVVEVQSSLEFAGNVQHRATEVIGVCRRGVEGRGLVDCVLRLFELPQPHAHRDFRKPRVRAFGIERTGLGDGLEGQGRVAQIRLRCGLDQHELLLHSKRQPARGQRGRRQHQFLFALHGHGLGQRYHHVGAVHAGSQGIVEGNFGTGHVAIAEQGLAQKYAGSQVAFVGLERVSGFNGSPCKVGLVKQGLGVGQIPVGLVTGSLHWHRPTEAQQHGQCYKLAAWQVRAQQKFKIYIHQNLYLNFRMFSQNKITIICNI